MKDVPVAQRIERQPPSLDMTVRRSCICKAKKHSKAISVVSGLLLIAIGILIITGWPHTI